MGCVPPTRKPRNSDEYESILGLITALILATIGFGLIGGAFYDETYATHEYQSEFTVVEVERITRGVLKSDSTIITLQYQDARPFAIHAHGTPPVIVGDTIWLVRETSPLSGSVSHYYSRAMPFQKGRLLIAR